VIVNKSDRMLDVIYQFRRINTATVRCVGNFAGDIPVDYAGDVPIVIPIADLQKQPSQRQQIDQNDLDCDVKELRVKFPLKPKMAVVIAREGNYYVNKDSYDYKRHLGINYLKLNGDSGSIFYEGIQVIRGFKEVNQDLYVLEYE
jgi:hypothetical protein